jgi:sugar phosphate isomerase/epimerase
VILPARGRPHLTYCTNVHPGETWPEVRASLEREVVAVKRRVSPAAPFGVGLRLSDEAARALEAPAEREALRALLAAHDLYVFTLNGFPYGPFHGRPVKERVYRPDWLEDARLAYANRLAWLLAALLPDGVEGSISTVPGAFRPRAEAPTERAAMAARLIDHAVVLHEIRERTGRTLACALEPEPCCVLETVAEAVAFFEAHLLSAAARARFERATGLEGARAEEALRRHLGLCLDVCHAAVEFEDPDAAVGRLRRAGIAIAKVQLSTGLRVRSADAAARAALGAFADDVYLHQVVIRRDGALDRFLDLPEALAGGAAGGEWRVHFHVPVFRERLGPFENTQDVLARVLALQAAEPLSAHLEVETYTWGVLPPEHRGADVVEDVARELAWVAARLGG